MNCHLIYLNRLLLLLIFGGIIFIQHSCTYHNEEDLYPHNSDCDTSNITYSESISDMMETSCNGCHGALSASGGVITDNYNDLSLIANDGRLWGAINHESGFQAMPLSSSKLPECELSRIRKWIDDGALNN